MRARLVAVAVGLLCAAGPFVPAAWAQEPPPVRTYIAVPVMGQLVGYLPLEVTHLEGGEAVLVNADLTPHTVTSLATDDDGYPLFRTGRTESGDSRLVAGVEDLPPGSYPFYCSIHTNMPGTLTVVAAGSGDTSPGEPPGEPEDPGDTGSPEEEVQSDDRTNATRQTLPETGGGAPLAGLLALTLAAAVSRQRQPVPLRPDAT